MNPRYRQHAILLMGDYNMIPGQDVSNFYHLGGDDVMDFVSCWDLQERFSHILASGRENLLDGFAVSRRFSTRYVQARCGAVSDGLDLAHGPRQVS